MEWLNRLRGQEKPVRATIAEIAGAVATAVQERTNQLIADLQDQGFAQHYPDRFSTLAFAVECLPFEAFLMDVITAREFGPHADAIREKLADYLFQMAASKGVSREHADQFDRLRETRFGEYIEALRSSDKGRLERLADVGWHRISGGKPETATSSFILFIRAGAALKGFTGLAAKYQVVG